MATASPSSSRPSNEKERALNQTAPVQQEEPRYRSNLEEFEREGEARPPFILSYREVKLLGIAGVRPSESERPGPLTRPVLTSFPSRPQVGFFLDGA